MSNSSRIAFQAFRSIRRPVWSQLESTAQRQCLLSEPRESSRRTFYTRSSFLAQATPPAAPSSSTASAAAIESSLQTEQPLPSLPLNESDPSRVDWSKSFHGLSSEAFPKEAAEVLLAPIDPQIVEIKPDGIIYMPEIHYRRILNRAFGPGAWGLAPRGETIVTDKAVTREYALVAHGR